MSKASTVRDYLAELPPERRQAISTVRDVIRKNLPKGFDEGVQFGMIGWYVPLTRYPKTYNGKPLSFISLAAQKGFMALYLLFANGDPEMRAAFEKKYRATGKKLDGGKSCVRFNAVDDLALDVIGEAIAKVDVATFIANHEKTRGGATRATKPAKRVARKASKKTAKPAIAKKTAKLR